MSVADEFAKAETVPSIIPVAPATKLEVNYGGRLLEPGQELMPHEVRFGPRITFAVDPEKNYTLVMIDPDNLSRKNPSVAEWLHWLVVNIPASNLKDGNLGGQVKMAYGSPGPQPRTDIHRYLFLLYQQDNERVSCQNFSSRAKFKVKQFAEKNKLGDPVAGNLFYCKNPQQ